MPHPPAYLSEARSRERAPRTDAVCPRLKQQSNGEYLTLAILLYLCQFVGTNSPLVPVCSRLDIHCATGPRRKCWPTLEQTSHHQRDVVGVGFILGELFQLRDHGAANLTWLLLSMPQDRLLQAFGSKFVFG